MYSAQEKKEIRQEFWTRFRDYSAIRRRQKGKPAKWIMSNTGIRQLKLKFEFDETRASVGIDIETRNLDRRIELYEKLESMKTVLHNIAGSELNWELEHLLENGKSISRISKVMENVSIYDRNCWPEIFPFFYKTMMKMEAFYEEYRDILKQKN
jgi:hypothetical protein